MRRFMQYGVRAERNEMIHESWKKLPRTQWIINMRSGQLLSWGILKEASRTSLCFIHLLSASLTPQTFLSLSTFSTFSLLLSIIPFFLKSLLTACFARFLSSLSLNAIVRNQKTEKKQKKGWVFDEFWWSGWRNSNLVLCGLEASFRIPHERNWPVHMFYWLPHGVVGKLLSGFPSKQSWCTNILLTCFCY